MSQKKDTFYQELLNDFWIESQEHYESMVNYLKELVPGNSKKNIPFIELFYRSIHSLKGAARAIDIRSIEKISASMEELMSFLKGGGNELTTLHIEKLSQQLSLLQRELIFLKAENPQTHIASESLSTESTESNNSSLHDSGSVRVSTSILTRLLEQSDNFIAVENTIGYYKSELENLYNRHREREIYELLRDITSFKGALSKMSNEISNTLHEILLSNFGALFWLLEKMINEIALEHGKKILFKNRGAEVEVDRRILDQLKDPLIHIIRNAIDHGIEEASIRERKGKPAYGTIIIEVESLPESKAVIRISDDGAGINRNSILESAIRGGVIAREEAKELNNHEIDNLIFKAGVSSKKFITDLSGRGIGMSVVETNLSSLEASISIESVEGKGTSFNIIVPQQLSTFRAVMVKCGRENLMIPLKYVENVTKIEQSQIITTGQSSYIRDSDGKAIPICRLSTPLSISGSKNFYSGEKLNVITLVKEGKKEAFIVDELYQEYESSVRSLSNKLHFSPLILGVTLINNGIVVPVINVPQLFNGNHGLEMEDGIKERSEEGEESAKVLIVEDSITIRSMLRGIVEGAGYQVTTAVDGSDAISKFKNEKFDIIVTDIEMPNINGFELTRIIKQEFAQRETPVILVTALENPQDRNKGMEAGADAYIVKSSFEKSNLIEVIKRFV